MEPLFEFRWMHNTFFLLQDINIMSYIVILFKSKNLRKKQKLQTFYILIKHTVTQTYL